jgi:uncharacterized protein YyaL (SSP411 family)
MAHESFDDHEVAEQMNKSFVNIKVDREEYPDIDRMYMSAVQLMTGQGGWPLNVVCVPDGRPVWGGTYFPKDRWLESLQKIVSLWNEAPDKVLEYADNLEAGIQQMETIVPVQTPAEFSDEKLIESVVAWSGHFDHQWGGMKRPPKFPMPSNYLFLLRTAYLTENEELKDYVLRTLLAMGSGGIYDQIGGGFARYSTDIYWRVPHFEKMLYDNAQLISLFAEAYSASGEETFKRIALESLHFLEREMYSNEGFFLSALDADTEGEEGRFYVWDEEELRSLIAEEDWQDFQKYFKIDASLKWEGNYILQVDLNANVDAEKIEEWKSTLLDTRENRTRPGLDDKALCGWNAMMVSAYADLYRFIGLEEARNKALDLLKRLQLKFHRHEGGLWHTYKEGVAKIPGYMDDHAFFIQACISAYEISFDEEYLSWARQMTDHCLDQFSDLKTKMFCFTAEREEHIMGRSVEKEDNVIPSSNSIMAMNLFKLGQLLGRDRYIGWSKQMLANMEEDMLRFPTAHSHWALLHSCWSLQYFELAISGPDASNHYLAFEAASYHPNKLIAGSKVSSALPLLQGRDSDSSTRYFICRNRSCQIPTTDLTKALEQIA